MLGLGAVPRSVSAPSGDAGGANGMTGGRGADRIVLVPVGTIVKRLEVSCLKLATGLKRDEIIV